MLFFIFTYVQNNNIQKMLVPIFSFGRILKSHKKERKGEKKKKGTFVYIY